MSESEVYHGVDLLFSSLCFNIIMHKLRILPVPATVHQLGLNNDCLTHSCIV